ncbi:putative quinol monooxygenase [Alterisphingorhabdus coralli]|uniref:Quinol monooxygenase n=1 Tax=Alterisphingorhabdus coralli TaxID=3071408 RepID=A0AA97F852_9SPHN|nr:putative quinol monooxygenase [Parasphingorhabdus sp. SCSIO 66989]WOE74817.1 putative quinol monooxygenase [Parasphingorhabdus sp. SCSIO 66989]
MLIVEGWIKYAKGDVKKLRDAAARAVIATNENEEGCLHYSIATCVNDPDTIRISERWRDEEALQGHFGQPHMTEFMLQLAKANRIDADVRVYNSEEVRRLL